MHWPRRHGPDRHTERQRQEENRTCNWYPYFVVVSRACALRCGWWAVGSSVCALEPSLVCRSPSKIGYRSPLKDRLQVWSVRVRSL